ncbi:hypothetical protein [Eremococcus coleocola]|uniref:hypothetical protein n=1 Tax=Eremococcus coleocola TaxID=88132 RepID=UPI0004068A36|nr:hypothetical protein [Eremococcus coleocola]
MKQTDGQGMNRYAYHLQESRTRLTQHSHYMILDSRTESIVFHSHNKGDCFKYLQHNKPFRCRIAFLYDPDNELGLERDSDWKEKRQGTYLEEDIEDFEEYIEEYIEKDFEEDFEDIANEQDQSTSESIDVPEIRWNRKYSRV